MTIAQLAAIYKNRDLMSRDQRKMAIRQFAGSPLGVDSVASLLRLRRGEVRYVLGKQRGGYFNPDTIPDIVHLAYLRRIGARLDRDAMTRVQSAGTSQATVAALMGISRQRLHQLLNEEA